MPPKKRHKAEHDFSVNAFRVVEQATSDEFKAKPMAPTKAAKGGQARAAGLTPARRKAIAKKAATARWKR